MRAGGQDCGQPAWEGRQLPAAVMPELSCLSVSPSPLWIFFPWEGWRRLLFHVSLLATQHFLKFCGPRSPWRWLTAPFRGGPRPWSKEAETVLRVCPFPTGGSPVALENLELSAPALGEHPVVVTPLRSCAAFRIEQQPPGHGVWSLCVFTRG